MMNRRKFLLIVAFVVGVLCCFQPEVAYAGATECGSDEHTVTMCIPIGSGGQEARCTWDKRLITANIVHCVEDILNVLGNTVVQPFATGMSATIGALSAIMIALVLLRAVFGLQDFRGKMGILVFKILLINYFVIQLGILDWQPIVMNVTREFADIASSSLSSNSVVNFEGSGGSYLVPRDIFEKFDLVIKNILGAFVVDKDPNYIGIATVITFVFFMGPWGILMGLIMLQVIIAIITASVQLVFIMVAAMLILTALIAFSPVVIPMILFDQTKRLFEQWLAMFFSYSLQPVVLAAFLALTLNVLDDMIAQRLKTVYEMLFEMVEDENNIGYLTIANLSSFESMGEQYSIEIGGGDLRIDPTEQSTVGGELFASHATPAFNFFGRQWHLTGQPVEMLDVQLMNDIQMGSVPSTAQVQGLPLGSLVAKNADGEYSAFINDAANSTGNFGQFTGLGGGNFLLRSVEGQVDAGITVPYVKWSWSDLKYILASFLAAALLLMVMVAWMRQLPRVVNEIVGNRTITPLVQYANSVTNFGERVANAAKGK